LPCQRHHCRCGALLPHLFTIAPSLASQEAEGAVYFLWHFPADFSGWPLATAVPCPARTFLHPDKSGQRPPDPPDKRNLKFKSKNSKLSNRLPPSAVAGCCYGGRGGRIIFILSSTFYILPRTAFLHKSYNKNALLTVLTLIFWTFCGIIHKIRSFLQSGF